MKLKLLAIDDDPAWLELLQETLRREDLEILTCADPEQGLELFLRERPRIVLLDVNMPKLSGMDLLDRITALDPITEVILLTADASPESAVEAVQKGARDYLGKTQDLKKIKDRIAGLLAEASQRQRALELERELVETYQFEGLIGRSPQMLDLFALIRRVAPHFRTASITGATGTGKELVARALHRLSPVSAKPFAVCNCSAVVETLLESELFGYVRGAFTGAVQDKQGLFEFANGGTVFLDEVGDLPAAAQAKLLRVLQNQEIQRVGSPAVRKVDVRVVTATNRDLRAMVADKTFREDLYYRLSMIQISLPRLSQRMLDLPLLQRHFLQKYSQQYGKEVSGLTRRAQALLARYSWPGNVRELENVIGRACMMAEAGVLDVHDFPEIAKNTAQDSPSDDAMVSLEVLQQRHVLRVLERVGGDKKRAAEILGIARATLYSMLARMDAAGKHPRRQP